MARRLNKVLPFSNSCLITWREKGSGAGRSLQSRKSAKSVPEGWTGDGRGHESFTGPSSEERFLASVCASLARAPVTLVRDPISFRKPLHSWVCFSSPLHLHKARRGFGQRRCRWFFFFRLPLKLSAPQPMKTMGHFIPDVSLDISKPAIEALRQTRVFWNAPQDVSLWPHQTDRDNYQNIVAEKNTHTVSCFVSPVRTIGSKLELFLELQQMLTFS